MSVTNWNQFEEEHEANAECAVWEAMCPDAVDGTLSPAEQAAFDKHLAGCTHCSEELDAAQRGAAWLHMLKGNAPEPPAGLMARILAETSGSVDAYQPSPAFVPEPVNDIWTRPRMEPARHGIWGRARVKVADIFRVESASAGFQPRFAMTAAMAFFSIALSLNLMGVRLNDLRHLEFKPGSIGRTVATATASATRSFQNNRVVYQLESRVSELRNEDLPAAGFRDLEEERRQQRDEQQQKQDESRKAPHGTSELRLPPAIAPENDSATTVAVRKGV